MVSRRVKFIAITVDELVLVPLALVMVYYFLPEFLAPSIIIGIVGSAVFVAIKYYWIYPSLSDESYVLYDMKGVTGTVYEQCSTQSGKIKVGQEIWDARYNYGVLESGTKVQVISRDSMLVTVEPYDQ
ncbi:MAG: NfeD family protein [Candidatus Thorarchaeota archaeon]|jgi:membrane protein implicated in regulation of membrane protease activity